jgi:hypothetical protein
MERPTGVTVIALFEFLITTVLVVIAITSALGMGLLGAILRTNREMGAPAFAFLAGAGIVVALFVGLLAGFFGALGYGLWSLRNWARLATIVLAILGACGAALGWLWAIAHLSMIVLLVHSVRLAINLVVLWYLTQNRVRQAFATA